MDVAVDTSIDVAVDAPDVTVDTMDKAVDTRVEWLLIPRRMWPVDVAVDTQMVVAVDGGGAWYTGCVGATALAKVSVVDRPGAGTSCCGCICLGSGAYRTCRSAGTGTIAVGATALVQVPIVAVDRLK